MDKPIFGEKKQFADYQTRYAAYIVIERDQQIAVIEAPNGAFFLPGGEIEGEETKEADEYFYSNYRATYYYNPGYFFVADSWKRIGEPTEKTNKIWWVSPQEALVKLKRGSHRWAVERWIEKNKN